MILFFFNTTKDIKKYGKTGMFLMPNTISDIQKQALYQFAQTIKDFSINIFYDLNIIDGFLEGDECYSIENESPEVVLEMHFKKIQNQTKNK